MTPAAKMIALLALALPSLALGQHDNLRAQLLATPLTPELGGETTRPVATKDAFTFVAGNAPDLHKAAFKRGNLVFTSDWSPAPGPDPDFDGLGPFFNRNSCFKCHLENGRGSPPTGPRQTLDTSLVRISVPGTDPNGGPNPVPIYGDQIRDRAIEGVPPEARPEIRWTEINGAYGDGNSYTLRAPKVRLSEPGYGPFPAEVMTSFRVSNPVIGLGLLESVPESTLEALADPDDRNGDGISGRVNRVFDVPARKKRIGRFGWKANVASLKQQNSNAALTDMGLSTRVLPRDLCRPTQDACVAAAKKANPPDGIEITDAQFDDLLLYMQLIAVPRQRGHGLPEVQQGERVFRDMGCADCHMPTLITAPDAALPELRAQTFHSFTDLLLHDMGEGLADNRPDWLASGTEWRTAPLWGLGLTQKVNGHMLLLHDGRAHNVSEAILWHGGEAQNAKENFRTASKETRADLLAFLNSL